MSQLAAFLLTLKSRLAILWMRVARAWSDSHEPAYRTKVVTELPPKLAKRILYVIEEDGYEEQAAMLCPCGCCRILHMNLLPDERPCWHLTRHDDGTSTLDPSIWRKKDCWSHFWFRRGRVNWVRDERKMPDARRDLAS